jgi:hypothetical protein
MKRLLIVSTILVLALALVVPIYAMQGVPGGQHWQVNIIGVPKGKKVDMTDSQRRTIFVPLDADGSALPVKIYYTTQLMDPNLPDNDFHVLDGNATDGKAVIQVPYDPDFDYSSGDYLAYDVYAIALGKPQSGGLQAEVLVECTYDIQTVPADCADSLYMGGFTLRRNKGGPTVKPISDVFMVNSVCIDANLSGTCDTGETVIQNIWIFNLPFLSEYLWDYDANSLKLMQVRFYRHDQYATVGQQP